MHTPYVPDPKIVARIANDHCYHAPKAELNQAARYEQIREAGRAFAMLLLGITPPSREQSLALTHIEEAVMMANAAIARNE